MAKRRSTCTEIGGCDYPWTVGLTPGVDISIDGDIWPGSPYDRHIDVCPAKGRETARACGTPTREHSLDAYPWRHANGGRIPTRYGGVGSDTFDPQEGHCRNPECYGIVLEEAARG